jgi:hypothetical protein
MPSVADKMSSAGHGVSTGYTLEEAHVNRWVEKLLVQNADVDTQDAYVKSIRLKAGNKDPHSPAGCTLEEAHVIGTGATFS